MGARVAVAGASGYAGGELLRLLAGHPDLELTVVTADSSAGKTVGELHPNLAGLPALARLTLRPHAASMLAGSVSADSGSAGSVSADSVSADSGSADSVSADSGSADSVLTGSGRADSGLADCDLVFLALPAGQSAGVAAQLPASVRIVDLGPDFRLADAAAWDRHYGGPHAGTWVTGIPELPGARDRISAASLVAAPGCYATAAILALVPLAAAGFIDPADVVIVAASGTSGAGRTLRANLLASEVMSSVSAYEVGGSHRHTPEIEQALEDAAGSPARVSFTPVLAPMPRGILATCTARLTDTGATTELLQDVIAAAYAGEPFMTLLPGGHWPSTGSVAGSNCVHLQVTVDHRAGRAVVVAAMDNLGKGAAGQAIQNANLMLGLPETAGLSAIGVAP
jgi:N-acetyl-gamma-glutamyl-phosphate reductase